MNCTDLYVSAWFAVTFSEEGVWLLLATIVGEEEEGETEWLLYLSPTQWEGKKCSCWCYMVHHFGKVIKHPPENESFAGRGYFHPMPCRGRGSGSAPIQLHCANSSCIIMQVLGAKQGFKCFSVFLPRYMNIYVDWQKLIVFIYLFFNSFWGGLFKDILKKSWMEDRLWDGVGCLLYHIWGRSPHLGEGQEEELV